MLPVVASGLSALTHVELELIPVALYRSLVGHKIVQLVVAVQSGAVGPGFAGNRVAGVLEHQIEEVATVLVLATLHFGEIGESGDAVPILESANRFVAATCHDLQAPESASFHIVGSV